MNKIIVIVLAFCAVATASSNYRIVCYHTNWSQYRPGAGKFNPENIDPFLCTHIMYSFAKIDRNHKLAMFEWNDDKLYKRTMALKKKNAQLKISLAVGGWNHENGRTSKFSVMVNNNGYRKTFIHSCVAFLRKWGFDGLDIDWEYPAGRDNSPPGDKKMFTILVWELLQAFDFDAKHKQLPRLLLSAAVPAGSAKKGYEVAQLGKLLDWMNLMTYDMHGNWDKVTGHHTAMADRGDGAKLTVPYAVDYWLQMGFPAHKITLGLATYGRAFRLKDKSNHGLGAPKAPSWPGPPKGKYTREAGFLAYYEICGARYKIVHDNVAQSPYGYKGTAWVGFDDEQSLIHKVKTQIKAKGLGGAMFWALPLDDFSGTFCGKGKFPLITAVAKELSGYTPTKPAKPAPKKPATPAPKPATPVPEPATPAPKPATPAPKPATPAPKPATPAPKPATPVPKPPPKSGCHAAEGPWKDVPGMDNWCVNNCAMGYCPPSHCKCT